MKIHVLGVGSIGSLVAAHLHRYSDAHVRIFKRPRIVRNIPGKPSSPKETTITIKRGLPNLQQDVFPHIDTESLPYFDSDPDYMIHHNSPPSTSSNSQWSSQSSANVFAGSLSVSASPISSLILSTKANSAITALRPIVSRLSPESTVTILQNGMGTLESILSTYFPDPDTRPHFILAFTTHGAYRPSPKADPNHIIWSGPGQLNFSVLPNKAARLHLSSLSYTNRQQNPSSSITTSQQNDLSDQRRDNPVLNSSSIELLSLNEHIPNHPSTTTLHSTVAALLSMRPLNPLWFTMNEFQVKQMRKLAVNCVINPITAILDVPNGALWGSESAYKIAKAICKEASDVFAQLLGPDFDGVVEVPIEAHSQQSLKLSSSLSPSSPSSLPSSQLPSSSLTSLASRHSEPNSPKNVKLEFDITSPLHHEQLFYTAESVMKSTSDNVSSTLADIRAGNPTEIDYLNGFVSRCGKNYGIPTPVNDAMIELVKTRLQLMQFQLRRGFSKL